MRGKTRTVSTDQTIAPSSSVITDTARPDKRRRVDEPETSLSPVAHYDAHVLDPVSPDMDTRIDEIAADVPLREGSGGMGNDQPQGWITEEAFFTVSPGARQVRQRKEVKTSLLTPAEKREFLKSMGTESQTLLKNQAAKVFSQEETARARETLARSCDGYSLARIRKLDDSMPSGRPGPCPGPCPWPPPSHPSALCACRGCFFQNLVALVHHCTSRHGRELRRAVCVTILVRRGERLVVEPLPQRSALCTFRRALHCSVPAIVHCGPPSAHALTCGLLGCPRHSEGCSSPSWHCAGGHWSLSYESPQKKKKKQEKWKNEKFKKNKEKGKNENE